ncbi:sensor histidine kinase [Microbacterium azadirachtae]|uniref:histidine kinase n=1 Tax=Microbacterium azadirachtae TaxID=582680 RepID=A0A0F0LGI7_9MICO|nr:HAMP domain-containing sensor histidine kinase [Microbacterium azadirachtae]KJL32238.1 putative sensor histidine kinase TcrY [Microbacterium azadirachtae]
MRRPRSLRLQVVLIASALVAAVSIVVGVVAVLSLHDYMLSQVDARLNGAAARGADIAGGRGPGSTPGTTSPTPAPTPPTRPSRNDVVGAPGQSAGTITAIFRDGAFEIGGWIASDGVRHDLTAVQKKLLAARLPSGSADRTAPVTLDLGGALGDYRVAGRTTRSGVGVVTALPLDSVTAVTGRLTLVVALVGLACIVLAIAAAAVAMGRALRPLRRVAHTATAVTSVPLDRGEVRLAGRVDARDIASTAEVGQVGTALNDMLDHVESALAQREASESTMRRFVADASHELRTPLATIRAYAQLSDRADAEEPEIRGNAALIDVEGVRMGALIDQLLLLARLDALPALAQDEVDLRLLLAEAVLAARLAGPDHVWILELGEDAALVRGDAGDLRRVVDNLLGNARVHTPEGTTVRVRLDEVRTGEGAIPESAEGSVRLTVADDGPGLPEAVRDTVFERFARGETSRSREGGGTGLGMAIARAVVEAHGGTITLGQWPGTTFVVTLPIAGPDADPDASRRITLEG